MYFCDWCKDWTTFYCEWEGSSYVYMAEHLPCWALMSYSISYSCKWTGHCILHRVCRDLTALTTLWCCCSLGKPLYESVGSFAVPAVVAAWWEWLSFCQSLKSHDPLLFLQTTLGLTGWWNYDIFLFHLLIFEKASLEASFIIFWCRFTIQYKKFYQVE